MAKTSQCETRPREQYGGTRCRTRAARLAARRAVAPCACNRRVGDDPVGARTACPRSDPYGGRAGRDRLAFRVGERRPRCAVGSTFTPAPAHRIRWIAARYHCSARIGRSTVARSRLCVETLRIGGFAQLRSEEHTSELQSPY